MHADGSLKVRSLKGIYAGPLNASFDRETTEQLRAGLNRLFKRRIPVLERIKDIDSQNLYLVLGQKAALEFNKLTNQQLRNVSPGGYIIQCDEKGIVIAGPDPWSTRYGVYAFLEKLGMRLFSQDFNNAHVTKPEEDTIPFFSIYDKPAFAFRSIRPAVWGGMYYQLGDPHNGLNPELFDEKKTRSDLWIDHTAGYLVPKLLYYDSHPEYFAMQKNGKRIPRDRFTDHRTPLCLSNPDVTRISIERALGWIRNEPDKRFFFISYGDTGLWCQSPQDLQLDPVPGEYTDRLLSWVNPIARAVKKEFPDKILMTFAYGGTSKPPKKQIPENNLWIVGSTGLGGIPFWGHVLKNDKLPSGQVEKIKSWLQIVPDHFAVCEYQGGTYKPALIDTMTGRLRYYQKLGIRGVVFSYGRPKNFTLLWKYLWGRLMWNPDQDALNLARGFIDYHYGPAFRPIWNIIKLSHERYVETLKNEMRLKRGYPVGYYSDEFTKTILNSFLEAGKAAAENSKLIEKIRTEERYFIQDWMDHPGYEKIDKTSTSIINSQLNRLFELAGKSKKEQIQLARSIHRLALRLDASHPGTLDIAEKWIKEQNHLHPTFEAISDGVRLTPESFMFAGYGPKRYSWKCPPRYAVGIYVKGNSQHRSSRMIAEFELDASGDGIKATLILEGQASEFPLKPKIAIKINGKEIFSGSADFVKNNWSKQTYPIPEGFLRKGPNSLEFINISHPNTVFKWNQRWILISDAIITLG